jgi:MFS family permease
VLDRVRFALRALRHRDLRLFLLGQGISLIGTWMQQVAISWLVYRLTGSTLMLGLIAFCSSFPTFVVAGPAGALADRWSRYRMVVWAQVALMVEAVVLAALVITGTVEIWHLSGLVYGFDVPARQALIVRFVRGQDLPNAIALNSSIFNGARLVGPAIAGVLISVLGEGPVFVLNALSYVAVLGALWAVEARDQGTGGGDSVLRTMGAGFRYAFGFPPIRAILVLLTLISLVGLPYGVLLPVFAADILGGEAGTLGLLTAAAGLGALAGALTLASRASVQGLGDFIVRCLLVFGAALIAFAYSRSVWLSAGALTLVGFGIMATTSAMNTILQTLVDEEMRGRVMALYTMAFIGLSPLGALFGGALADRIGAPLTVAGGGAACIVLAWWFARQIPELREMVLPIYRRLGIIPEVAAGLQTATDPRVKE